MDLKEILLQTYCNKTVLITGHTGFKGGWLAVWLESLGAKVFGYSLDPPTNPSFFDVTCLANRITDIRGDILDRNKIMRVVHEFHPDFIFHLAAQPLVLESYKNPLDTFHTNVMGTANLLESIRTSQRPTTCVCITSDKCYENREWVYAYRENDSLGGYDPYSASKGAAEIVISSYRNSFFNPATMNSISAVSSARAGNIIGGGDWAGDRIVPDCVKALSKGERIKIRNPHAIRPWQFILEPLFGYLWLAGKMKQDPAIFSGAWNFGPFSTNSIDVQNLAERIIYEWASGSWEDVSKKEDVCHEAGSLQLDIAKSTTKLGWRPVYSIHEAIHHTIVWYQHYYSDNVDMYTFSLDQIYQYTQDAGKIYDPIPL